MCFKEFDRSLSVGLNSAFSTPFPSLGPAFPRPGSDPFSNFFPSSSFPRGSLALDSGQGSRTGGWRELALPGPAPLLAGPTAPPARVTSEGDLWSVELEVGDYRPEELCIKTEGAVLTVEARQEGRGGTRQFRHQFSLPAGVQQDQVTSSLSPTGLLIVSAPRAAALSAPAAARAALPAPTPALTSTDRGLELELDLAGYRADSLEVRVEGDNLVVAAEAELQQGGAARKMEQRFALPPGTRPDLLRSTLSREGRLTVTAPAPPSAPPPTASRRR